MKGVKERHELFSRIGYDKVFTEVTANGEY